MKDVIQKIPGVVPASQICISEIESVRNNIASFAFCSVEIELVEQSTLNADNYYFISSEFKLLSWDNPDAIYLWLDTGYKTPKGEPVFISLLRQSFLSDVLYKGYYVGTANTLVKYILQYKQSTMKSIQADFDAFCKRFKQVDDNTEDSSVLGSGEPESRGFIDDDIDDAEIEYIIPKVTGFRSLVISLNSQLIVNPFISEAGLAYYLNIIGSRINDLINDLIESRNEQNIITIESKRYVVINSGLLNEYGNLIQLLYERSGNQYTPLIALSSKQQLVRLGFAKSEINRTLKPIWFAENNINFHATFDDFDITDQNINHIVKERYDRIKIAVGGDDIPFEKITQTIISELRKGLELCAVDSNYAKALYSCKRHSISWCLPCRIRVGFQEPPELVIVISQVGEFMTLKTVLAYDDYLRDRLKCLRLYSNEW